jgi:hypothetical protein
MGWMAEELGFDSQWERESFLFSTQYRENMPPPSSEVNIEAAHSYETLGKHLRDYVASHTRK